MSSLHIGQDVSEMTLGKLSQSSSFLFTVKPPFCPTKGKAEHPLSLQCHPQVQEVPAGLVTAFPGKALRRASWHTELAKALEQVP